MKISKPIQYVIAVGGLLILGLLGWNAYSAYQESNAVTSEPAPIAPKPKAKASPTPVAQKASAPAAKASPTPVAQKASAPAAQASSPATAFYNAVNKATSAAELTQTAKTKTQWSTVATNWQQAIALMKAVPKANPNHQVAQQKVVEYQKNLNYAQQASANAR
ncbi:hypothetical protein H6F98_28655 [Microcoleus sp. FACHB-SPT15]|uniref:hypothetical protein n=1 Tax=Microcoleus sp. FACHB-SPT15 TaxID=2692830 RepID=UPI00177E23FC|nr:hypothetical protein [Microcoleus sp. FACHB-SPT15]MBD1809397.1 hypothetical protein [Microcoleus sp. FACHB-SPT15]